MRPRSIAQLPLTVVAALLLTAICGAAAAAPVRLETVTARPAPAVWLDTDPMAPHDPHGKAGIQVGGTNLTAPPLAVVNGTDRWYEASHEGTFLAAFQIVVLDRRNLNVLHNWTYGLCGDAARSPSDPTNAHLYLCRNGKNSRPDRADPARDLSAVHHGDLVIATDHHGAGWYDPRERLLGPVYDALNGFGLPNGPLLALVRGGFSLIGARGIPSAEATVKFQSYGRGAITGYLGYDREMNFAFTPNQRVAFDTRRAGLCEPGGYRRTCEISQQLGSTKVTASFEANNSGYLLSRWDEHTLALEGKTFVVTNRPAELIYEDRHFHRPAPMIDFLQTARNRSEIVMITAVRGPSRGRNPMMDYRDDAGLWAQAADQVGLMGGTHDAFNRSAVSSGSDYTLVGWPADPGTRGEGWGAEAAGAGATLHGVLALDRMSRFRPVNDSAAGAVPDALAELVLRRPDSAWPLTSGESAQAVAWIGEHAAALKTPDPRTAYWQKLQTANDAKNARINVDELTYQPGNGFSESTFLQAQREISQELLWVFRVRNYLGVLQAAQVQDEDLWSAAAERNERLSGLTLYNGPHQLGRQPTAGTWFSQFAAEIGDIADARNQAVFAHLTPAVRAGLRTLASVAGLSGTLFATGPDGAPVATPRTVPANQIAATIHSENAAAAASYDQMARMIVSDHAKLQELGTWAQCGDGCDHGRYDEYQAPSKEIGRPAGELIDRAVDRVVYQRVIPLAYSVWDTGLTTSDTANPATAFQCVANRINNPFTHYEKDPPDPRSYTHALWSFDPDRQRFSAGPHHDHWRVFLNVFRHSTSLYEFPNAALLDRMYSPLNLSKSAASAGLGLAPVSTIPAEAVNEQTTYVPGGGVNCSWNP